MVLFGFVTTLEVPAAVAEEPTAIRGHAIALREERQRVSSKFASRSYIWSTSCKTQSMGKLDFFKAKARALAQSGYFYGLPPLEFELSFEEGFQEAGEWLEQPATKEEL
jgi:hypothetical protein